MNSRMIIILAIIVVIIIAAYALVSSAGKQQSKTTTVNNGGTTSMTVPPYITTYNSVYNRNFSNITGINVKLIYTGPYDGPGMPCDGVSKAYTTTAKAKLNSSQNFSFSFYISSSNCNFTITRIGIDNNGFTVAGLEPPIPYQLPAYSQIQEVIAFKTPLYNFTGPLSVTVYAK